MLFHQNGKLTENDEITVNNIHKLLPDGISCIVNEIITKSLVEPGTYANESVFIPTRKEMKKFHLKQKN